MNRAERRRIKSVAGGQGLSESLLHEAARHHRAGALGDAEQAYRAFLAVAPGHAQALHLLGLVCHQTGRNGEAATLIAAAERAASTDPEVPYNLGNCLVLDNRPAEAIEAFKRALALRPGRADALNNLGNALQRLNRLPDAIDIYREALKADPDRLDALSNLGHALQAIGRFDEAIPVYREVLQRNPQHPTAAHMIAAMTGETPASAPDEFVRRLFDGYAERFDEHLIAALDYDPNRYISLLRRTVGEGHRFARALDLGCGTGLAASLLRSIVGELTGVDLSPAMVAKAEEKRVYDRLAVDGIEPYLEKPGAAFDLFVAADVFVYVGALEGVFAKAARRAMPGAWFAYSVERHDGDGFVLRPTGRYAHSLAYLKDAMGRSGWRLRAEEAIPVRTENTVPLQGYAVVAELA